MNSELDVGICGVDQCSLDAKVTGYCRGHYGVAWRMGIDPCELSGLYRNGCAVCGSLEDLAIDHDHSCCPGYPACGECVRGCLCRACNIALGHVEANLERTKALVSYASEGRIQPALKSFEKTYGTRERNPSRAPVSPEERYRKLARRKMWTYDEYQELLKLEAIFRPS